MLTEAYSWHKNCKEVKQQIENAPNVKAKKYGKMGYETHPSEKFNDMFAEIVVFDSVSPNIQGKIT